MNKKLNFNNDTRAKLKEGIDAVAKAVAVTLGAKGRIVGIERPNRAPHMTKDGVSVAKEIFFKDREVNMGAQLIKGVADKTADDAGDGTSTATILAAALITEGIKNVTAGANPIDLKRGIDRAVRAVVDYLNETALPIASNEQIYQVATISANGDEFIGNLIATAIEKVTYNGTITVEQSKSYETYVDVVEGLKLHRGYTSAGFVTNHETMEAVLDNPLIFLTPNKIDNVNQILGMLQQVGDDDSVLIIGGEISGEASATLAINKVRGGFKVAAIKAPFLSSKMKYTLEDLAVLTGGTVISEEAGLKFEDFEAKHFGTCEKVIITSESTVILNGAGHRDEIDARIAGIKSQIKATDNKIDEEELEQRLALIAGGVAIIYVGGNGEVEVKEKVDRVDDALGATRAAVEEGIVSGGGVALIEAMQSMIGLRGRNADETTGINIVLRAIEEPMRQIISNAGLEPSVIVEKVKESKLGFGFDVKDEEYVSMIDEGIIDPKKVTRVALENAASVASLVLMTDCTITIDD